MPVMHVNGIDINYVDEGRGEALVITHNLISNIHGFDFNIPTFSKYYRTIAYDIRGHGLTSKAETGYTFDNMTEDLYQLLRGLHVETCYLLGQAAVGIGVTSTFYMRHPEMVKAIIYASSGTLNVRQQQQPQGPPSEADMRGAPGLQYLKEVAKQRGMMAALEERRKTMTYWTPRLMENPEIWSRFEEMYRQTGVPAFLALPERISEERRQELVTCLGKSAIPILQLVGVEDSNPAQTVANIKTINPRAHGVILPDSGHYPAIENPDDFNKAVLNFLAGVRAYN